jgi:hypothetical protein
MPVIIVLENTQNTKKDISNLVFFLLKEEKFPIEGLKEIQDRIQSILPYSDTTKEDVILIAEDFIKEYGGTVMPYSLYIIKY